MKKIKAIGFDWVGVVFFTSRYHTLITNLLNISQEEFSNSYYKHNHLINTTDIDPKEFWTIIFKELGKESKVDEFLELLRNFPKGKYNEEILPLLKLLRNKDYKIGLFSNHTTAGAQEARQIGVDELFDITLFSAEVGVMKEDPEAFLLLAKKLNVDISEMIFIDDTPKVLENAEEIGFEPILYTDMPSLLKRLNELNILTEIEIEKL